MRSEEDEAMKIAYKKVLEKSNNGKIKNINLKVKKDTNLAKENMNLLSSVNILDDKIDQINKYHISYDNEKINLIKNKSHQLIKERYIHSFFGEIEFTGIQKIEQYPSSLSLNLYNDKIIKKIAPKNENMEDLENFNYRFFKYLDGYKDCFMSIHESEKTNIKENVRSVYTAHILNHLLKRNQEIERNNKLSKIIFKDGTMASKIKEELFVDKDLESLKNEVLRIKQEEIKLMEKPLSEGKELFSQYRMDPLETILNFQDINNITLEQIRENQSKISELIRDSVTILINKGIHISKDTNTFTL